MGARSKAPRLALVGPPNKRERRPSSSPRIQVELLRIVTRCRSLDEFIAFYGQSTDEESMRVHIPSPSAPGAPREFAVLLRDGTLVLRGEARAVADDGATRRPAVRLVFIWLDEQSRQVHRMLCDTQFADIPEHVQAAVPSAGRRVRLRAAPSPPPAQPANPAAAAVETSDETLETAPAEDWQELRALARDATTDRDLGATDTQVSPPPAEMQQATTRSRRPDLRALAPALGTAFFGVLLGFALWGGANAPASLVAADTSSAAHDTTNNQPVAAAAPSPQAAETMVSDQASPAAPATCAATLRSTPSHARVSWNGESLGKTPLVDVEVPCGDAKVVMRRRGYRAAKASLSATTDEPVEHEQRLTRRREKLRLVSSPAGARFTVNGKRIRKGRTSVMVPAYSRVRVTAKKPGYAPWSSVLKMRGHTKVARAKLRPQVLWTSFGPSKSKKQRRTKRSRRARKSGK